MVLKSRLLRLRSSSAATSSASNAMDQPHSSSTEGISNSSRRARRGGGSWFSSPSLNKKNATISSVDPDSFPVNHDVTTVVSSDDASISMATMMTVSTLSTLATSRSDDDDYSNCSNLEDDPYADVRAKMNQRAAADRLACRRALAGEAPVVHEMATPSWMAFSCYMTYALLILIGHLRDTLAYLLTRGRYVRKKKEQADDHCFPSDNPALYAPILQSWEDFYTRRIYHRVQDCFNRPITTNPGSYVRILERVSTDGQKSMQLLTTLDTVKESASYTESPFFRIEPDTGYVSRECLNLGSYNYLGFGGDDWYDACGPAVVGSLSDYSISSSASRNEYGTTSLHRELESIVARFLNKQDAMVFTMGYNTNATTIPALVGNGDLIISDELNHTSIVNGARASGAAIRVFRHNNVAHLEEVIREAIVRGKPRTRRPWNKILVIVEGIYSMEGEYANLAGITAVCRKYGAHVYLDEAHSIGCLGATGRGVSEYCGVPTEHVDIMMGTFTKSFGGMGGYIAADAATIAFLRQKCAASAYHNALSPVVCQQIISSFKVRIHVLHLFCSYCNW
jgi:serine palmitoyltransferase